MCSNSTTRKIVKQKKKNRGNSIINPRKFYFLICPCPMALWLYLPTLLLFLPTLLSAASSFSPPAPPPTALSPPQSPPSPPLPPSPSLPSPSQSPSTSPESPQRSPHRRRHRRSRRRQQQPLTPATPQQFNNIIDALIGSGDFTNWVNVISNAVLPLSATLFVPENDAVSPPTIAGPGPGDPLMFPYHVVPQRLSFPELLLFQTNTRLPTLLPGKSILITNNSRINYTIDGSQITQPDIYSTGNIAVHGVGAVFNYSIFGDGFDLLPKPSKPEPEPNQSQVRRPPTVDHPNGETFGSSSDSAPPCLCIEFQVVFLVFCAGLIFKIQRNGHGR
ncbi:FAS1 domain-containing protein SELMODRAFT_448915-like [Humulus lupulus]|uniref:FAS1 domain-containing protein SELMODRAFT_448915-like n=1 Tax=Humulus lupulus TaxID=3486 RepID=UPI002B411BD7|nr:FAS1 domain-containing protein SELMODRAFT_448915-like [Humulus lupulus]